MNGPRVYLHALGLINALGDSLDAIVPALAAGMSPGMATIHTGIGDTFAGSVTMPLDLAPPDALVRYDCRNNRLLLAALAQISPAIEAARERYGAHRIGVVLGTSTSGIEAAEAAFVYQAQAGKLPVGFDYRQVEIGTVAPFAAAALDLHGPAFTISTACTSSAKAFVSARRLLQLHLCDAVVVGGVDSLCELTVQGFASLESTSAVRSNPMSRNRCGINVGEGAAVFLMSRDEGPVVLAGVGESSDAHHISAPDPHGAGGEIALRRRARGRRSCSGRYCLCESPCNGDAQERRHGSASDGAGVQGRRGGQRYQAPDRASTWRRRRDRIRFRMAHACTRRRCFTASSVGR
jgi:3-oxoacyl-[acyl-carrier-protein] synthase-1